MSSRRSTQSPQTFALKTAIVLVSLFFVWRAFPILIRFIEAGALSAVRFLWVILGALIVLTLAFKKFKR